MAPVIPISAEPTKPLSPRSLNAQSVLNTLWGAPATTVSELMDKTGLTRATVLSLCKDLENLDWIRSAQDSRQAGEYAMGRPAKRYEFNPSRALVVGVDAGEHRISATVSDLAGSEISTIHRNYNATWKNANERREYILKTILQTLDTADLSPNDIHTVVVGVPAPVNSEGKSPKDGTSTFWSVMNPDLTSLREDFSWNITADNDANLAALADLSTDPKLAGTSFATVLAGERFGAGIVLNGTLLRQRHGMAGELRILDIVSGVKGTDGIAARARTAGQKAIRKSEAEPTSLAHWPPEKLTAENVFAEAERGDAVASAIVAELTDSLARVCAVLAGPLDLDRINIAGGAAPAFRGKTAEIHRQLQRYLNTPWVEIRTSTIGEEAVRLGALQSAIERVRLNALEDLT